jgi:hypothetical protein
VAQKIIKVVAVPSATLRGLWDLFEKEAQKRLRGFSFEVLTTEEMFRKRLNLFAEDPFDLGIFGVFIAFAEPRRFPPIVVPDEVKEQGYHRRAGFRCAKLLTAVSPTALAIIYDDFFESELQQEIDSLPPNVRYLRQSGDFDSLIALIRQQVGR